VILPHNVVLIAIIQAGPFQIRKGRIVDPFLVENPSQCVGVGGPLRCKLNCLLRVFEGLVRLVGNFGQQVGEMFKACALSGLAWATFRYSSMAALRSPIFSCIIPNHNWAVGLLLSAERIASSLFLAAFMSP